MFSLQKIRSSLSLNLPSRMKWEKYSFLLLLLLLILFSFSSPPSLLLLFSWFSTASGSSLQL